MASSHIPTFSPFILGTTITVTIFIFSLFTPSHAAIDCDTQKLPPSRSFANCTNLPSLGATLHFTYNATNHSLAVAYAAEPPSPNGWVAWGINPTGGGMVGTQAFIAFKQNGSVAVGLYNLTSYKGIDAVKALSFDTWDVSAEEAGGVITVFAVVKIPEKEGNLTQVWQVGPVTGGKPMIHARKPENLQAQGALEVVGSTISGNSSANGGGDNNKSGGGVSVMGVRFGFGFYFGLVLVVLMSLVTV
ncbi:auxin-induced in root cultures protein 12 [Abrus precatorius]|uniref:Auxin-induced in root cultures protein 12 n=1 Tax=Abrus precatorius TaxID=3816 RepID=A0A8B8K177_ABRPR|nr:auxin-induced in root cultures protein 12 [Abrus precatorius]